MDRLALEAFGGMKQREIDGQASSAEAGAVAENEFSEDDGMA